ncbi:uncharacterized protein N7487_007679 [Penicillium crustosum]|uniref:uncharacterized protein n=1 Tax=Penicillium crustosum TaxID=36656 RepID=UPI00238B962C|nr:uncharacterized protein N7487_007679 [Penicillium crustosum]KAJ5401783.1 hypothetical protein N7487_007679 [Penicillium crustosum]
MDPNVSAGDIGAGQSVHPLVTGAFFLLLDDIPFNLYLALEYHQVLMSLPLKLVQMETLPLDAIWQTAWLIAPQLNRAADNCIFLGVFDFSGLKATA